MWERFRALGWGVGSKDLRPVNRVGEDKDDKLKQGTLDSQSLLSATELTALMEIC